MQVQVLQLISINYDPDEMLKKVWFEDARELTLQSYLNSVSQEILRSKTLIFKNLPKILQIFGQFLPIFL